MSKGTCPPLRRRLKMSLPAAMLLVAFVGLYMGYIANKVWRQRTVVAAVKELGGGVMYDWRFNNGHVDDMLNPYGRPWGPAWLRRIVGDEYFQEIVRVDTCSTTPPPEGAVDDLIAKLRGLPRLQFVEVMYASDRGMTYLRGVPNLKTLIIVGPNRVTEAGIAALAGKGGLAEVRIFDAALRDSWLKPLSLLPDLECLDLRGPDITDKGLAHLRSMKTLSFLSISENRNTITDAGLEPISCLSNLEYLVLPNSQISERGLERIRWLNRLKTLWLNGRSFSKEVTQRFEAAMPN